MATTEEVGIESSLERLIRRRASRLSAFAPSPRRCARSAAGRAHRPRPAARTTRAGDRAASSRRRVAALLKRSFSCFTCNARRSACRSAGLSSFSAISSSSSHSWRGALPFSIRAAYSAAAAASASARNARIAARDHLLLGCGRQRRQRRPALPASSASLAASPPRRPRRSRRTARSSSSHRRSFAASVCHTAASRERPRAESIASTAALRIPEPRLEPGRRRRRAGRSLLRHWSCASRSARRTSASSLSVACASCFELRRRSPPARAGCPVLARRPLPCASRGAR